MNVTEFRKDISKHMDAALRGEKVTIERGGVTYQLTAYIDESGFLPKNLTIPKASPAIVQPTPTKPGMFDRDIQFCKHGNVVGTCVKGCK